MLNNESTCSVTKNETDKIKVLFISHSSQIRGAEKSLLLLLENTDRSKIEPVFLSPTPGPISDSMSSIGIKTYFICYGRWIGKLLPFTKFLFYLPTSLYNIRKLALKEEIDLIYTNSIVIAQGALIARWMKLPHIWHIREILSNNPGLKPTIGLNNTYNVIRNYSSAIIAISKATAKPVNDERTTVIYNATEFVENSNKKRLEGTISTKNSKISFRIGVIGELHARKAQDDAIKALSFIREKIPNVELIFLGKENKLYGQYLRKLIAELGLEKHVFFMGFKEDVKSLITSFDLTLMPSWEEPFGRVTIESMAMGIPVVGTNSGGTAEIIEHGITGFLTPPNDPKSMADKATILLKNAQLRSDMGNQSYERVKNNYSPIAYANSIADIIVNTYNTYNNKQVTS